MSNGLNLMKLRLQGEASQQARMIKDKRRTLDKAVQYSYQGASIRHLSTFEVSKGLILPDKVSQDYDIKNLSIGFEYGYQPGDIFEWLGTGTKWLIILQELTELAYFRGEIRKCCYSISWKDAQGDKKTTYAAVRGPQEKGIKSMQKFGFSMDLPNYSLCLLLPNNDETIEQFQRYSKFYLKSIQGATADICWRVEAIDSISTPGILEVYAREYYSNTQADNIEEGIVNGLVVEPVIPEVTTEIEGDVFIKPKIIKTYTYIGNEISEWIIDKKLPIEVIIKDKTIELKWNATYSGQFTLQYGSAKKTIIVESLF